MSTEAIAYLITISSSSINSPYNLYSACLLPTIHLGNTASHSNRSYTLPGGSRLAAGLSIFHNPPLLPRTIAYTATKQVHQQDAWDRIRCLTVNWNTDHVLYLHLGRSRTVTEQLHQQDAWDRIRYIMVG
jgi:hypothetical protein